MNLKMKAYRAMKELSQESLSQKIGVSRQTILLIENENYNPSLSICIKICEALDCTLNDLFWNPNQKENYKI